MPKRKKALTEEDVFGKNPILEALNKQDITCDDLAKKLRAELGADQVTEYLDEKGKLKGKKKSVAWATRQQARQDAHKLRGDYPIEKMEHSGTIIFQSNVPEPDPLPEEGENG